MMTPTHTVGKINDDDDHAWKHSFAIFIRNTVDTSFNTIFNYTTVLQGNASCIIPSQNEHQDSVVSNIVKYRTCNTQHLLFNYRSVPLGIQHDGEYNAEKK